MGSLYVNMNGEGRDGNNVVNDKKMTHEMCKCEINDLLYFLYLKILQIYSNIWSDQWFSFKTFCFISGKIWGSPSNFTRNKAKCIKWKPLIGYKGQKIKFSSIRSAASVCMFHVNFAEKLYLEVKWVCWWKVKENIVCLNGSTGKERTDFEMI